MFTGLIEDKASIVKLAKDNSGLILTIRLEFAGKRPVIGDSIAVNGACLTVAQVENNDYSFYVTFQTLELTNLGLLTMDSLVNIERAMLPDTRFGGHIVSGHVDCIGKILNIEQIEKDVIKVSIEIPEKYAKYIVERGSITVDGISLTIVSVAKNIFGLVLIPETLKKTNAGEWQKEQMVNIEFDLLIRYVESLLNKKED